MKKKNFKSSMDIGDYIKKIENNELNITTEEIENINKKYDTNFKVKQESLNMKAIANHLLGETRTSVKTDTGSYVTSNENETIEQFKGGSFIYSREIKDSLEISKSNEEVLNEITKFILKNGGLRDDLKLKSFQPSFIEKAEGTKIINGYTAQYVQIIGDTYIDGIAATAITIGYDSEGVNFYLRNVKEVTKKIKKTNNLKKMNTCLEKAKKNSSKYFKSIKNIHFKQAEIILFSSAIGLAITTDELVPAYKFSINDLTAIYIDAETGEFLNGSLKDN